MEVSNRIFYVDVKNSMLNRMKHRRIILTSDPIRMNLTVLDCTYLLTPTRKKILAMFMRGKIIHQLRMFIDG
jgi:hypothetical protein